MKKVIIIFVVFCVFLSSVLLNSNLIKGSNDNYIQNQIVTSGNQQTDSIKIYNYYDLVFDTVKKHLKVNDCDISRVYMQEVPYYIIECKTNNVVIDDLEKFSLKVSKSIYNDLLKYYFEEDIDVSNNANKIISISYYIYENNKITASYCVQFNMSEVDCSKSFEENLLLHQMISYPRILY